MYEKEPATVDQAVDWHRKVNVLAMNQRIPYYNLNLFKYETRFTYGVGYW